MKQLFFNFEKASDNHLVYLYYILFQFKHNFNEIKLMCSCKRDFHHELKRLLNVQCFDRYDHYSNKDAIDMYIKWSAEVDYLVTKETKKGVYTITTVKEEKLHKINLLHRQSDSLIDDVQKALHTLSIKTERPQQFWKNIKQSISLKQLINTAINHNKRLVYLDIFSEEQQLFYPFYREFITKCIETGSFTLLIRAKKSASLPVHPDCVYLGPSLVFSDHVHLIKRVDIVLGSTLMFDHFSSVFNKPLFLIIPPNERQTAIKGYNVSYFNSFLLQESQFIEKNSVKDQAKKCFSLLSALIYDINLNKKIEKEQLHQKLLLINTRTGVLFKSKYDYLKWNEKNTNVEHLVDPIVVSNWRDLVNKFNFIEKNSIACIVGKISIIFQWALTILFYLKKKEKMVWLRQPINMALPFSYWVGTLIAVYGRNEK